MSPFGGHQGPHCVVDCQGCTTPSTEADLLTEVKVETKLSQSIFNPFTASISKKMGRYIVLTFPLWCHISRAFFQRKRGGTLFWNLQHWMGCWHCAGGFINANCWGIYCYWGSICCWGGLFLLVGNLFLLGWSYVAKGSIFGGRDLLLREGPFFAGRIVSGRGLLLLRRAIVVRGDYCCWWGCYVARGQLLLVGIYCWGKGLFLLAAGGFVDAGC